MIKAEMNMVAPYLKKVGINALFPHYRLSPEHKFFTYKHYLDGNGDLLDKDVVAIIARAMIRNKPDSYCQAWDLETSGIALSSVTW